MLRWIHFVPESLRTTWFQQIRAEDTWSTAWELPEPILPAFWSSRMGRPTPLGRTCWPSCFAFVRSLFRAHSRRDRRSSPFRQKARKLSRGMVSLSLPWISSMQWAIDRMPKFTSNAQAVYDSGAQANLGLLLWIDFCAWNFRKATYGTIDRIPSSYSRCKYVVDHTREEEVWQMLFRSNAHKSVGTRKIDAPCWTMTIRGTNAAAGEISSAIEKSRRQMATRNR